MKTKMNLSSMSTTFLAIATVVLLLFTGCSPEDTQATSDDQNLVVTNNQTRANGPSVNGHGTLTFDGIPIAGEGFRQFTFHAKVKNNGSTQGSGVLTYTGGVRNLSFDIDCLSVDGNHAIMSGVITRDNQFPENEGVLCWFEVFDNGEGNNADSDQMSLFFSGLDPVVYDCANDFVVDIYDIEGGNIQVRD